MRASWHIALSGLSARPVRNLLLAAAVLLASSLVTAVACGIGSARRSVEARLNRIIGATDARILEENGNRFDDSILDEVRAWPGVEAAGARLFSSITLVHEPVAPRGKVPADDAPQAEETRRRAVIQARGIDLDTLARFGQVAADRGRLPSADNEVLVDSMTVRMLEAPIGSTLRLQRFGAPMTFIVVGEYDRPSLGMLQRPELIISRAALTEATDRAGEASVISIILDEDDPSASDVVAWCAANAARLPEGLLLEPAELITTGYDRQVRSSNMGFLLASVIAFLACSFIVATGMTTAVVEQERLMAIVRAIGATRGQLFGAQVLSGLIICGAGGIVGVPVGVALAGLLVWRFGEWLPEGLSIEPLGVILAVAGAAAAGVGGSIYPAWRASRVTPLEALAARARVPTSRGLVICGLVGAAAVAAQLGLALLPNPQQRFWAYVVIGLPLAHVGWFLMAPAVLTALAFVAAGAVGRVFALPRGLLRAALSATPFRAGFTGGALMVGVAILVSSWSNGTSLLEDWVGRIRFADGFVFRVTGISAREQQIVSDLPFVTASCPISYLPLRVEGEARLGVVGYAPPNVVCIGFDPDRFFAMTTLDWKEGEPETAIPLLREGAGVLVAEQFLIARGLGVGDTIRLGNGRSAFDFQIAGVVSAAGLDIATQFFGVRSAYLEHAISCVFMDFATVRERFGSDEATMIQLSLDPAVDDQIVAEAIAEALPGVVFSSGRAIRRIIDELGGVMLAVSTGVAVAALLLGCFGVGNVIAAGIHARQHEFGVLRAIGGTRWLPARLVCAEAVIIGQTGAAVGTALGMQLAWMSVILHRDLLGLPMRLIFPVVPTALGWITVIALAALAALPAAWALSRRAPRELLGSG